MTVPDPKDGPTKAQLEAALYAIRPSSLSAADMRAALAAAIEVEKHDEIATTSFAINKSLSDASLKALGLGGKAIMERLAYLEAITTVATIERCAQVADRLANKYRNSMAIDVVAALEEVAAAIRAMKDQP